MKNLLIVVSVCAVLLVAVLGVRRFDAGSAPRDEILAYHVSPEQAVEVTLHGGVEQISVTSWLLVPLDTPVDEPLPYGLELRLSDADGNLRMMRRFENVSRLPLTAVDRPGFEARVTDALGHVTEPRTIEVDVENLDSSAGRLRVRASTGKYDQVLLRLAHRVERSGFEKRLLARTMSTSERDQLTRERSSLGFFDIPDVLRTDAVGYWHQRLTAAGREGRDYIVRRLLIGPLSGARRAPDWQGEGHQSSKDQHLAINIAGPLTLSVSASQATELFLNVVGRDASSVHSIPAERAVELAIASEGLGSVVLYTDPPSRMALSAPLGDAPHVFASEPPRQSGERLSISPDISQQTLYRLHPDEPIAIGVAPGQRRTGLSVRSTAADTERGSAKLVRVTWEDGRGRQLSSAELGLKFEPSLFETIDERPVTSSKLAQLHVPAGAARLLVFGTDDLVLSIFVEEPGVDQLSYRPPFDVQPPEGLRWAHAPLDVKDWAAIRPDNEAALRLAGRTATLRAQIRLEPSVAEDPAVAARTLVPKQEVLGRPVFSPSVYSTSYPFPENGWVILDARAAERAILVPASGEVSALYLADTARLGQPFSILAGAEVAHRGTLSFRSGALRLPLPSGVVQLGSEGLGAQGLLLVQAPPAGGGVILKRQTFYALDGGARLDFDFQRGEAELLTVVVMVLTEGGNATVAMEHAIDGGRQAGRLDHFHHRTTEFAGLHELRTGARGEALIWSEPFAPASREALGDRLGRAVIPLGDDLAAGRHRLTLRHPGRSGRKRYWVRAVVLGRVLADR